MKVAPYVTVDDFGNKMVTTFRTIDIGGRVGVVGLVIDAVDVIPYDPPWSPYPEPRPGNPFPPDSPYTHITVAIAVAKRIPLSYLWPVHRGR